MSHITRAFWALAALVLALGTSVATGIGLASASAQSPTALVMVTTQKMSGPSLTTTLRGYYSKGARLSLSCFARGQAVYGYFGGPDSIWYQTTDGSWVADIDLDTGSWQPVTGPCSTSTSTKATRAVAWANSQVGSSSYYNLCERFVENAYGTSGRYASAIAAYRALQAAGQIETTRTGIPAGALVFSSYTAYDGGYGHVELSRGDGTFVSGGADGPSVKVYTSLPAGYLGWAYAPSSWPGR